eukprot:TRINITY_DN11977_c0_g1_i4.p1 TRINITY_DN11977_c0_g1~~TRINITY_DN11977_c0_g1_i4.p1  ORF type:complete len:840 (+),score=250.74 TRINITY_DN11977_c0_g1_i4:109-2520(+)
MDRVANEESLSKELIQVHKIYLYAGAGSLLCTSFVLFIYYYSKRYRMHPNGILIHFMSSLWVSSLCYFLNGLSYLLGYFSANSFESGKGKVVLGFLGCSLCDLEATVRIFFATSFLCWNLVWLYDLIKVFKQPMHTTKQLLPYYRIVVYFVSSCALLVYYTFRAKLFASKSTHSCFIDSGEYKNMSCILDFLYLGLAGYTICRYGRDSVVKRFKKTESKLQSFFKIQKCYFFLNAFCWALKAICLSRGSLATMQAHDIARSVEPVILSLPWILSIANTVHSYESLPDNESNKRARRKSSLFSDISDKNDELQAQSLEDPGMNKKIMDDSLRNEIVEYLFKGIRRSLISYSSYKQNILDTEDSDVGSASMLMKDSSVLRKVGLIDRKEILREAKREQILKIPLDNYRMAMNTPHSFADEDTGEFHDSRTIKFVSLGPKVFQNLRSLLNVNDDDIMSLFSIKNLNENKLQVVLQSGKGGSFFIVPNNGQFIVKSINKSEYSVMRTILGELYIHYLACPGSCVNPVYGCYALHLSENDEIEPQYFILMKNVLGFNKEFLPEGTNLFYFDLKGSSAGRKSLVDPSILLDPNVDRSLLSKTFMDRDFQHSFRNLSHTNPQLLAQLDKDSSFFANYKIIDYSLLLIIVNIPCAPIELSKSSKRSKKSSIKEQPRMTFAERAIGLERSEIVIEECESGDTVITYKIGRPEDVRAFKEIREYMAKEGKDEAEGKEFYAFNFASSRAETKDALLGSGLKDKPGKGMRKDENQVTRRKLELNAKSEDVKTGEYTEQPSFESNASTFLDEVLPA